MPSKEQQRMWKLAGRYVALGLEMGIAVAGATWLGSWADASWGTEPWFLLFGMVVGAGAATKAVLRTVGEITGDRHVGNLLPVFLLPAMGLLGGLGLDVALHTDLIFTIAATAVGFGLAWLIARSEKKRRERERQRAKAAPKPAETQSN